MRSAGLTLALITLGFAVAVGCDDRSSSVSFYQAPKDSAAPVDSLISGGAPAAPAQAAGASLAWTAPAEWKPLPAQQMRVAAYRVSDSEPAVEFTVIPLGPEAGELLPNVNRWENQLALAPTPQDKLDSVVKHQDINGLHADIVDLTGSKSQSPQQRMLAAIVQYGGRVWFFKMLGPEPIVSSQKQNFDAFMQSLHPQPPAEAAQPSTQSLARSSGTPSSMISWKAPDDWRELPGSQPPRMLAFEIGPADAAEKTDLIITRFAQDNVGSFRDNINRWRAQLGLEPLDDSTQLPMTDVVVGKSVPGVLLDFAAPARDTTPARRMLVVIAASGGDLWFYKLTGPAEVVGAQKPAFEQFLQSIEFDKTTQGDDRATTHRSS